MAPSNDLGVAAPRTDPILRLLYRFYEPLHLLCMLNASRGPGETPLPADPRTRTFHLTWRRFLDDLSWICDNRHGGETVSAVAAQSLPEGNKFWLVSTYDASFTHLQWVMEELKTVRNRSDKEIEEIANRIAAG